MLVAIACTACGHRGAVPSTMLARALTCSRCGTQDRFERGKPLPSGAAIAERIDNEDKMPLGDSNGQPSARGGHPPPGV